MLGMSNNLAMKVYYRLDSENCQRKYLVFTKFVMYKGDYMKGLINDLFWPIIIILCIAYLLLHEIKNKITIKQLKLKIKYTDIQIVDMQITNKRFCKT